MEKRKVDLFYQSVKLPKATLERIFREFPAVASEIRLGTSFLEQRLRLAEDRPVEFFLSQTAISILQGNNLDLTLTGEPQQI